MSRLIKGVNDLQTLNPKLASEWHSIKNIDLKPSDVLSGSGKSVWWQCKYGHEWQAKIQNRYRGGNCPYCSNKNVLKGFNDLLTKCPELAREWSYSRNGSLRPDDVTVGSRKIVWWKCKNGHEWKSRINHRVNGSGCPFCSGRNAISGVNDLATLYPDIATEFHPYKNIDISISDVKPCSGKKIWWLGKCGHEWQTVVRDRVKKGYGCPFCSGGKVLSGFNDILTYNHRIIEEWDFERNKGLHPSDIYYMSNKKYWWRCSVGHTYQSSPYLRISKKYGCPICNESHLESVTRNILIKYEYTFIEQVKFYDLFGVGNRRLSFDFAIVNNDEIIALIECQGRQHYMPINHFGNTKSYYVQIKNDKLKLEFCIKNHFLFLEIPYVYDEMDIEEMFQREII